MSSDTMTYCNQLSNRSFHADKCIRKTAEIHVTFEPVSNSAILRWYQTQRQNADKQRTCRFPHVIWISKWKNVYLSETERRNQIQKWEQQNDKKGGKERHRNVYLKSSLREREGSSFDSTSRNEPFIFQDVNTGLRAGNFSQWLEEKGRLLTSRGRRREIRGKRRTSWTWLFRKNNFQQVLTFRAINLWDEYSGEYSDAYVATRVADIYLNTQASEISEMSDKVVNDLDHFRLIQMLIYFD